MKFKDYLKNLRKIYKSNIKKQTNIKEKKNLKKHLLKQTFWTYILTFLATPLGLFIKMLYSKELSLENFGLFYMIIGFYLMISIFNDLGFTDTLNYFGVKFYEKKDYRSLKLSYYYAIFMQLIIGLIISTTIILSSNFLATYWFKSENAKLMLNILTIYFVTGNLLRPMTYIFLVKLNIFWNKIFNLLYLGLIFIFSYIGFKISEIRPEILISEIWSGVFFFLAIFYFILVKIKFKKEFQNYRIEFDKKLFKKLWSYAIHVVIGGIATLILGQIDTQMIGILSNTKNVGYYTIALSTANILSLIITPISILFFPLTTKLIKNNKKERLEKIIKIVYKFFLTLTIPLLVIMINYSKTLIKVLFGAQKFYSNELFIPLVSASFLNIFYSTNFQILAGLGLIKERNKILFFCGISNVVLNYLLFLIFGFVGIAYSTLIVSIIFVTLTTILIWKQKIKIYIEKLPRIIINGIFFYFSIEFFKKFTPFKNFYLDSISVLVISGTIYGILCFLLKIHTLEEILELIKS